MSDALPLEDIDFTPSSQPKQDSKTCSSEPFTLQCAAGQELLSCLPVASASTLDRYSGRTRPCPTGGHENLIGIYPSSYAQHSLLALSG